MNPDSGAKKMAGTPQPANDDNDAKGAVAPRKYSRSELEASFSYEREDILVIRYFDAMDEDRAVLCEIAERHLNGFKRRFSVVMDMRNLSRMPPTQRAMYAAAREAVRANYRRHHVLTVYVVHDTAQRGMLTAIGWIAKAESTSGRVHTNHFGEGLALARQALDGPSE